MLMNGGNDVWIDPTGRTGPFFKQQSGVLKDLGAPPLGLPLGDPGEGCVDAEHTVLMDQIYPLPLLPEPVDEPHSASRLAILLTIAPLILFWGLVAYWLAPLLGQLLGR